MTTLTPEEHKKLQLTDEEYKRFQDMLTFLRANGLSHQEDFSEDPDPKRVERKVKKYEDLVELIFTHLVKCLRCITIALEHLEDGEPNTALSQVIQVEEGFPYHIGLSYAIEEAYTVWRYLYPSYTVKHHDQLFFFPSISEARCFIRLQRWNSEQAVIQRLTAEGEWRIVS